MTSVLYIPGLGSGRSFTIQRSWVRTLNVFRSKGKKISIFDSKWESNESYIEKYGRLKKFYDETGKPPTIWAVSAGASLGVRLCYDDGSYKSLNLVCGKVYGPEKIGQFYRQAAPAFVESVEFSSQLAGQLRPESCLCYVPIDDADGVIETKDMSMDGSKIVALPPLKHVSAIIYALAIYLPRL